MRALLPTRLRHVIIRTLLVVLSLGMGFTLFRLWQVKQEVDAIATKLTLEYGPQTTLIYDSKDRVIAALYKEHRMPMALEQMSEPLIQAVLAAEDRRFYEHSGIDVRRIGAGDGAPTSAVGGSSRVPAPSRSRWCVARCWTARRPTAGNCAKRGCRARLEAEIRQDGDPAGVPQPRLLRRG